MRLDFDLLSMTELRNRPGEILDRVADEGQAFIIERSGKQKACLVPLSVFLPDISPSRIAAEIDELVGRGEESRSEITEDREVMFRFQAWLSTGSSLEIQVLLPHGYPNNCPRVYVNPLKSGAPHQWRDGALCLYGVMSGWNPGKHTVASTLQLAKQWLRHYERWCQSGEWPSPAGSTNE